MTRDQRHLIQKAGESIRAAHLLRREGLNAFAVSRAYYAMFYLAEATLLEKDLTFSKHSAVIAGFGREVVKAGAMDPRFHRYLREAQDQRNIADYATGDRIDPDTAEIQIHRAEEFLSETERLLSG